MARRKRSYKLTLDAMRYQLYKTNQALDVIEAILDLRYKPSYWNMRKLISRLKRLNQV